jgi:hypothetical protein
MSDKRRPCPVNVQYKTGDGQPLKPRAVVLVVYIQHHPDGKSLVEKAANVSPDDEAAQAEKGDGSAKGDLPSEASAKGEDPLKAVGDGVKDYQSVVSTAADAKSATDKAKSLIGF